MDSSQLHRRQTSIGVVAAASILYGILFIFLYPYIGSLGCELALLPVMSTGWLFGMRAGLLAGLIVFPVNVLLLNLVDASGVEIMFGRGLIPYLVSPLVGGVVGQLHDVSQRLQQELAKRLRVDATMQASEQRYRLMTELISDYAFAIKVGTDGTLTYEWISDYIPRVLGNSIEELNVGRLLPIHPDDQPNVQAQIERVLQGRDAHGEARVITKNGDLRWVHIYRHPVWDTEKKRIERYYGVLQDITERKRAEEESWTYLHFLESLDHINRAMQGTTNLEQMMKDVLDVVLTVFNCDRAWLVYPCDPDAVVWQVPMERTRPEYPGVLPIGVELPLDPAEAAVFRILRESAVPVQFNPSSAHQVPIEIAQSFHVQAFIAIAFFPKVGKAWGFGLHQCWYARVWNAQEVRLFEEISRRLAGSLTSLLVYRDLRDSEHRLEESQAIAHVGYWDCDLINNRVKLSEETRRIFGLSSGQAIDSLPEWHDQWRGLVHPEDRRTMDQAVEVALSGGPRFDVEYRVVRPTGEVRIVHNRGDVSWDEEGRPRRWFGVIQDITVLRQAEQELCNSEMRFRTFVDHATDAFFMHYTQGIVIDVNRQACESLGYTREELIGMTPKMFDPNATPEFMAFLDSRLRNGETVSFDTYHQRKDGTTFPVEVRIRPFTDRGHWASVSLVRDITERKQREAALRRQNEYLTALHETTLALMNHFNTTEILNAILSRVVTLVGTAYGSVFLFSPDKTQLTAAIYTGYSREMPLRHAEIGKGLSGMVWQTGQTVVVNDYQNWEHRSKGMIPSQIRANIGIPLKTDEALIGILCVDYHEVGRTFSDEDVAILTRFAALASIALVNAQLYNSVQQELAERKQVELTLQRYNKRLSILRDIDHQILFASSPQSIANVVLKYLAELIPCEFLSVILHDPELTEERIFALRHTPELGGVYTQEIQPVVQNEVLEKLKSGKTAIAPDLRQQAGPHAHLAEELESHGVRSALASPMIVQDRLIGTIALAACEVGFFTSEHQQITEEVSAQIAIALQQAELKEQLAQYNIELEQRVRERTTQLEHANHELELFSYSVSHDLRAPLRAIQGFAEIIARRHRATLNEESVRYFDNIVLASEQMNQLIIDLLAYARLGRGGMPRLRAISLDSVFQEVITNLTPQLMEAQAQIHVTEALPIVLGDSTLLKQIFTNLLENAIIYHRVGVPPVINVSCAFEAEYAIIRVIDNGIGIPAEFHEKIFHIFQRLYSQDQYPGTGIGLAIVRKSVEMLNGSVWVELRDGQGSVFCVKLKSDVVTNGAS